MAIDKKTQVGKKTGSAKNNTKAAPAPASKLKTAVRVLN